LSDAFTVVAWDGPGCGRSSDPPDHFSMSDYADCLARVVEALGLHRPHVAGLSFGGTLALELYRRHPALPRTLTLASAYAGWAGSLPPNVVAERLESVTRDSYLTGQEFASRWVPTLLTDNAPAPLFSELASIIAGFRPHGARTMAKAMAGADCREVLASIRVPTLLLYGDADVRSPLNMAKRLRDQIPGSRLIVLEGVGHQLNMEAADRFNSSLRDFLRSSSSAADV
jgi:pimeloyl-ACP methyl ester carboxylesterase